MGNSCSPGCRLWCLLWRLLCCPFFPLDVLDGIWDLIESVSEGFLIYSCNLKQKIGNIDVDVPPKEGERREK